MESIDELYKLADSIEQATSVLADEDVDDSSSSSSSSSKRSATFLNVVALGNVGAGKSAVLNSLIGHPVLPTGENGATRAPISIDLQRDSALSTKSIMLQIDSKSQQVSASALRHSLQDRLSKSAAGNRRTDEIYLKLRTSTAPPLKLIDLPGLDQKIMDDALGPFRLVAEEGKAKSSGSGLSDSSNGLVREVLGSVFSYLVRMNSLPKFGTSERQWVEAQVENAKQQAILAALKSQVETHIHLDLHSLRRKHSDLGGELSNLYRKVDKLLSETIPDLCWELAELQDTYILQGDYDLKVMRQEYYIGQQKAVCSLYLQRQTFITIEPGVEVEVTIADP